jgi:hypothetical protein
MSILIYSTLLYSTSPPPSPLLLFLFFSRHRLEYSRSSVSLSGSPIRSTHRRQLYGSAGEAWAGGEKGDDEDGDAALEARSRAFSVEVPRRVRKDDEECTPVVHGGRGPGSGGVVVVADWDVVRGGIGMRWPRRVGVLRDAAGGGSFEVAVGLKDSITRSMADFISSSRELVAGVRSCGSCGEGIEAP